MHTTASSENSDLKLRQGNIKDLPMLTVLEEKCFDPAIQCSEKTIRRSLTSRFQEVWVLESGSEIVAAVFMRIYERSVRIYSLAVSPSLQQKGLGNRLLQFVEQRAAALGRFRLTLEARTDKEALICWYEHKGYSKVRLLKGYYSPSVDAWKMVKTSHKIKYT